MSPTHAGSWKLEAGGWLYPAFSINVMGFSLLCTTSRVMTHSRIFF
jgi:hypothetical protein